jgi:hypothetical protein
MYILKKTSSQLAQAPTLLGLLRVQSLDNLQPPVIIQNREKVPWLYVYTLYEGHL